MREELVIANITREEKIIVIVAAYKVRMGNPKMIKADWKVVINQIANQGIDVMAEEVRGIWTRYLNRKNQQNAKAEKEAAMRHTQMVREVEEARRKKSKEQLKVAEIKLAQEQLKKEQAEGQISKLTEELEEARQYGERQRSEIENRLAALAVVETSLQWVMQERDEVHMRLEVIERELSKIIGNRLELETSEECRREELRVREEVEKLKEMVRKKNDKGKK